MLATIALSVDRLDALALLDRALAKVEGLPPEASRALRALAEKSSPQRVEQLRKLFEELGDG